jgi:Mg2+ and Co2+ transporter CorA
LGGRVLTVGGGAADICNMAHQYTLEIQCDTAVVEIPLPTHIQPHTNASTIKQLVAQHTTLHNISLLYKLHKLTPMQEHMLTLQDINNNCNTNTDFKYSIRVQAEQLHRPTNTYSPQKISDATKMVLPPLINRKSMKNLFKGNEELERNTLRPMSSVEMISIQHPEVSVSQKALVSTPEKAQKRGFLQRLTRKKSIQNSKELSLSFESQMSQKSIKRKREKTKDDKLHVEPVLSKEWIQELQHVEFLSHFKATLSSENRPEDYILVTVLNENGGYDTFSSAEEVIRFLNQQNFQIANLENRKSSEKKTVIWIDIEGADEKEITHIGLTLGVHPLTIEDCYGAQSRQKLEPFENYLFVIFQSLHHLYYSENKNIENPIKLLVFSNLVMSFHRYPSFAIRSAFGRLNRMYADGRFKSKYVDTIESMDILHIIADSLSFTDLPIVKALEKSVDNLQDTIYKSELSFNNNVLQVSFLIFA